MNCNLPHVNVIKPRKHKCLYLKYSFTEDNTNSSKCSPQFTNVGIPIIFQTVLPAPEMQEGVGQDPHSHRGRMCKRGPRINQLEHRSVMHWWIIITAKKEVQWRDREWRWLWPEIEQSVEVTLPEGKAGATGITWQFKEEHVHEHGWGKVKGKSIEWGQTGIEAWPREALSWRVLSRDTILLLMTSVESTVVSINLLGCFFFFNLILIFQPFTSSKGANSPSVSQSAMNSQTLPPSPLLSQCFWWKSKFITQWLLPPNNTTKFRMLKGLQFHLASWFMKVSFTFHLGRKI